MPDRGDAFLALGLIPAMAAGASLDLTDLPPVSSELREGADRAQEILAAWNAELRRVPVLTNPLHGPASGNPGHVTMFSGGVDGLHAALHAGAVKSEHTLVVMNGFDEMVAPDVFAEVITRCQRLAGRLDARLLAVRTNWVTWRRSLRLSGALAHGTCLSAVGHLLAPERLTIASSNSGARLTPWGTHPLLDPQWSTEHTRVRHFGTPWTRAEKVAEIARHPELIPDLLVCHVDPRRNCGRCAKCLRTIIALRLAGSDLPTGPTAAPDPVAAFARLVARGHEYVYVGELRDQALRLGDPDTARRLEQARRAQLRRRALRRVRDRWFPALTRRRLAGMDLPTWGRTPPPEDQ